MLSGKQNASRQLHSRAIRDLSEKNKKTHDNGIIISVYIWYENFDLDTRRQQTALL